MDNNQAPVTMEYKLIPMDEIDPEARRIAVLWHESATDWIGDKHKLASDIMNYAAYKLSEENKKADYWREQWVLAKELLATKEEAIKELVQGLCDLSMAADKCYEATEWPADGKSHIEVEGSKAKQLIQKHKV